MTIIAHIVATCWNLILLLAHFKEKDEEKDMEIKYE
jgi:hypothetical protein